MKIKGQDLTFSIPHAFQWELKKNIFFLCLIVCQELIFFLNFVCVGMCICTTGNKGNWMMSVGGRHSDPLLLFEIFH